MEMLQSTVRFRALFLVFYYSELTVLSDWVVENGSIMNTNSSGGELAMILTKENGGTRLSSTRYVHYGTITARRECIHPPSPTS